MSATAKRSANTQNFHVKLPILLHLTQILQPCLMFYFNINKSHCFFLFFFHNTSYIRNPQVIWGGGGVHSINISSWSTPKAKISNRVIPYFLHTCMQVLSTIIPSNLILGYSLETSSQVFRNNPSPCFLV